MPSTPLPASAGPFTRLNVTLIPNAAKALTDLQQSTGFKKVDVVNKALQLYAAIDERQRQGGTIYLETAEGDVTELIIL